MLEKRKTNAEISINSDIHFNMQHLIVVYKINYLLTKSEVLTEKS